MRKLKVSQWDIGLAKKKKEKLLPAIDAKNTESGVVFVLLFEKR